MLTQEQISQMKALPTLDAVPVLVAEIERLQKFVRDYSATVTQKIDLIDQNRELLEGENQRLLTAKEIMSIERDACVALVAKLALVSGNRAGIGRENAVIVDLPSGQVSWQIQESEAHLVEGLPSYTDQIEEIPLEENYRRVMNPGIGLT
jgi:hypothetical protein